MVPHPTAAAQKIHVKGFSRLLETKIILFGLNR